MRGRVDPIAEHAVQAVCMSVERVLAVTKQRAPAQWFRDEHDFATYWAAAEASYGSDDLAIAIAEEIPIGSFGLTSHAFVSALTLEQALRIFGRDAQHSVPGMHVAIEAVTATISEVRITSQPVLAPLREMLVGILALRGKQLAVKPVTLSAASFVRGVPRDRARWERVFGTALHFGAAVDAIRVPTKSIEQPLRTSNAQVQQALGPAAQIATLADHVRAHIQAALRSAPSEEAVAAALGMSRRTLQRKLQSEGTSFRQLVTAVRVDVALRMLAAQSDAAIGEIAETVGFANTAAFSRAFSQRHGVSPATWRKRHGGASG